MPDGIVSNVVPFGRIAVSVPELDIPKILLPKYIGTTVNGVSDATFPEPDPILQRGSGIDSRSTEQMDVIWKDYIPANQPVGGFMPCRENRLMHFGCGKERCTVFGANCNKYDDRAVIDSQCWPVHWVGSIRSFVIVGIGHPIGPAGAGPSNWRRAKT